MNCNGYYQNIRAYCERELTLDTKRELEQHVQGCASCAAFHKTAMEITCREVMELHDYVAGTLPEEKRQMFRRHFEICQECRDYLSSYERTIALGKDALQAVQQPPVTEDFVKSILTARRKSS